MIFLLLVSLFPLNILISTSVAADPVNLILITQGSDYTNHGFTDLGIYYTNHSLCEFHMPFVLARDGDYETVNNTDLDGNFTSATGGFNERLLSYNYSILDSNVDFYVVDFTMNTQASTEAFSVDFVPNIKNVNFSAYGWWNSNWNTRRKIVIDYSFIDNALKNFPVLVNFTDTNFISECDDGDSVRFSSGDNSLEFNYEIEDWYANGVNIWVNISENVPSGSNYEFYIYYNNSDASDNQNPSDVWDSNYVSVYHMENTGNVLVDSTGNNLDGTFGTPPEPEEAVGVIGTCLWFDGMDDKITIGDNALHDVGGQLTIETWMKDITHYTGSGQYALVHDTSGYKYVLYLWSGTPHVGLLLQTASGFNSVSSVFPYDSDFHYLVGTYNKADDPNELKWYEDTVLTDTSDHDDNEDILAGDEGIVIGEKGDGNPLKHTYLDEMRVSNIERNASWIKACFHTQNQTIGFMTIGSSESGKVEIPTSFIATTDDDGSIDLSWVMGVNATYTRVEYNTIVDWGRGSGNLLYNDTGTSASLTSTSCNILYYFLAWSYNDTSNNWSASVSANNISCPGTPSSITSVIWDGNLNITWVKNVYADKTVLLRKNDSHPSSVTDGTVLYNDTGTYYNDSDATSSSYYTVFSWNETVGRYSGGLQLPWGQLIINVYDENTSEALQGWDLFISNEEGTSTFESFNNTNPKVVDVGESLPYGDDTQILINATYNSFYPTSKNYTSKRFVMDIAVNTHYTLDAYLAEKTSTEQYIISVVGESTEYGYEPPIEDVRIQFRRYINDSVGYQNVSILMTGAAGTVSINLIPLERYLLIISKSGYVTQYEVFEPPYIVYSEDRYHKFRLIQVATDPTQQQLDEFWKYITFNAVMTSPGYGQNGNITITYADSNSSTTNTQIYLYESFNGTNTLLDTDSRTSNSFSYTNASINTTRLHYVILYFNNTATFDVSSPVTIYIYALHSYKAGVRFDLDARIKAIVGPPPSPLESWTDAIAIILPLILLVSFGVYNTGLGLLGCGLSIGLIQGIYSQTFLNSVNLALVALCPLIIIIAIIYIWTKGTGSEHL